ncbi:MAG TPA: Hsp20/alpha crystallin family protein, partial [Bacillales bacterium]|nr:Hsp20/alpha crystallin family protein [Bacillales bacterium]
NSLLNKVIGRRGESNKKTQPHETRDSLREFESIQEEISKMLNQFCIFTPNMTKEPLGEYHTTKHDRLQRDGPVVYGYTLTVGPDGRPLVMEFGNAVSFAGEELGKENAAMASSIFGEYWSESGPSVAKTPTEREPVADINSTDREVKVVMEMPGVKEEDIAINAYDGRLEVLTNAPHRNYRKLVELPQDADTETARFKHNNGVLEVTFKKMRNAKPKGKEIAIE